MKVFAYLRVSSVTQDTDNQKFEILKFADRKGLRIDQWIEESVTGTKKVEEREFQKILREAKKGDVLIMSELSRISRTLSGIFKVLNELMERDVKVYSIKEGFDTSTNSISSQVLAFAFGLSAEIERNLISARTKEALAKRKAEGKPLGRPKGFKLENVKLSEHEEKIKELLSYGVSLRSIARMFDCHHNTVAYFIKSRGLK